MTSTTPPEQPKYFLVAEGDLNAIERMLGRKSNLIQAIRSLPSTAPTCRKEIDDVLDINSMVRIMMRYRCGEIVTAKDALKKVLEIAEPMIRNAERNATLDDFAREIQKRYVGNYDNEAGDIPDVPVDELAEIIRSLRQQSTEAHHDP